MYTAWEGACTVGLAQEQEVLLLYILCVWEKLSLQQYCAATQRSSDNYPHDGSYLCFLVIVLAICLQELGTGQGGWQLGLKHLSKLPSRYVGQVPLACSTASFTADMIIQIGALQRK